LEHNFYTILGIAQTATLQEIKLAYKRLALKHHPDRNPGDYIAEEQFKLMNSAYQTLSNPNKRAQYDLKLMYQRQLRQPGHHPQGYYRSTAYQQTRPPASVSERYYRTRAQTHRFSKRDLYLTFGFIAGILSFTILLKVIMDHIASVDNYKTALAYIADGRYTSAHSLLTDAIHFEPKHEAAYRRRAELEFNIFENYSAALSDLNRVIALQEKPTAQVFYMRGVSYKHLQNYKQAEQDLNLALYLKSNYWDAYLARGEVKLFYLQQQDSAIADFSIYIKHNQNSKENKLIDALTYRGFAYFKQQNFKKSEKDYRQALKINYNNGRVHYLMGQTQLKLEQPEIACKHFNEAYDLGYSAALIELKGICR
jgi:curved DNA-binding protein CbpA